MTHTTPALPHPKLRLAINGFGRIGRNILRAYLEHLTKFTAIEIVAINDVADNDVLLHLLRFDSTHGRLSALGFEADIAIATDTPNLIISHHQTPIAAILLLTHANPKELPWQHLAIDIVLECTGKFRSYYDASLHRQAGAKQVIIGAAPFDTVDASIVMGVNHLHLQKTAHIISGVSCTTQALVPLLFVLDKAFGITSAMMTEIHAVTADQMVLDQAHRDLRRARASGHNIIPTTSSSIAATLKVLPHMAGKLNGHSIRVPTINVAAIDVTLTFQTTPSLEQLRQVLQKACTHEMTNIMGYSDEPLVSSDFIHDSHSLIIDGSQLMIAGNQVKVFAWYDNEWGYASRLLDMCQHLAES